LSWREIVEKGKIQEEGKRGEERGGVAWMELILKNRQFTSTNKE
jgi:hypothetical protein